jgi:glycosyltransferase involved in cell wall biosynthesis
LRTVSPGDLVVAKTDPPLISTIAWIATRLRGAQLVNWLQDLYPEVAANLGTPVVRGPLGRWLKALRNVSLRRAAANVAIGEKMAEVLEAEGVARDKLRVIPNWADEETLRPVPTSESVTRKLWRFDPGDFVLGYSGNLGRAHEAETLLAAARLLSKRSDIRFLFIGGGYEFHRLEKSADAEALGNFVFKPHQPREDLPDTLGAADAHWLSLRPEMEGLIVPSKFYGILAAGRPIVAVAALDGEIGRIVRENECGIAVAPGDAAGLAQAVVTLAEDVALRRRMGLRARTLSETMFPRSSALRDWADLVGSFGIQPVRQAAISPTK